MSRPSKYHSRFPWLHSRAQPLAAIALTWLLLVSPVSAESWTISTVAGTGEPDDNGNSGVATDINVGDPFGVVFGPDGALYVTEVRNHRVRRVDLQTNTISTIAGNGEQGYSGDGGPATRAAMNEPYEVRFDRRGNLLVVEMQNHIVRRIAKRNGVITTVAGTGQQGFAGDGGPATGAQFSRPHSIALDSDDNIYVADIGNHRIRRIDNRTGVVTTIVGSDTPRLPTDGVTAGKNSILGPRALFVEGSTLWIALREGHSIWRMDLESLVLSHLAGSGTKGYSGDGASARRARFNGPKGIAVAENRVAVVDTGESGDSSY